MRKINSSKKQTNIDGDVVLFMYRQRESHTEKQTKLHSHTRTHWHRDLKRHFNEFLLVCQLLLHCAGCCFSVYHTVCYCSSCCCCCRCGFNVAAECSTNWRRSNSRAAATATTVNKGKIFYVSRIRLGTKNFTQTLAVQRTDKTSSCDKCFFLSKKKFSLFHKKGWVFKMIIKKLCFSFVILNTASVIQV